MKRETYQTITKNIVFALLIAIVFVLGAYTGTKKSVANFLAPKQTIDQSLASTSTIDLSEFWDVWNLLDKKYPFKKQAPDNQDKIYGAISGLVDSFNDPYTTFFPPDQAKLFNAQIKGSFGGVGMEVGVKNNLITVIAPIKNSPAEIAGIQAGDIITQIDDKKTDTMSIDTAIGFIRGDVGTPVTLSIAREGLNEIKKITIVRDTVKLPVLETSEQGKVFIISLYSFSENSESLFVDALKQFKASGKTRLVIDLRNNPGGFLESAIGIGSYFLPEGKTIVRENFGNDTPEHIHQSKGYNLLDKKPRIIILVNKGSASASEILAGALSEHHVATLVGTTTFGKGSVQELIDLPDKSSLKITIAKWLTPNGNSISEKGIVPDIVVEDAPILNKKTNTYSDPILEKAILLLK